MSVKRLAFRVASGAGLTSAVARSRWRRERLLILCYHGVSAADEHEWNPELYVTPDRLRARLARLRARRCAILPLDVALERLSAGTLPPRAVALTFDDGARDFAERAVPVLREFDAPATVYLTTYYCDHRLPVFDTALGYLLWKGRASGGDLRDAIGGESPVGVSTAEEREGAWRLVSELARSRGYSADAKHALLGTIAQRLGLDFAAFVSSGLLQIMSPEQVRALPPELVDIQLHTHRHRTPRERDLFVRELRDNAARIAELTGSSEPRRHFCYPSGDYASVFVGWLRDAGVRSATTCLPGLAERGAEPLLLPRFVDTMLTDDVTFDAWVSGLAEMVPRRARYRFDASR